jgi:hypothetical protein
MFILLAASLQLAERIFTTTRAAWSAVCVLACACSIFVAGTSIPIMDPFFTARTLSTPLTLVMVSSLVARRWLVALCALGCAMALHPLMAGYAALFAICYWFAGSTGLPMRREAISATVIPFGWMGMNGAARETLEMPSRHFFFASRWSAVDWAGVLFPLALFLLLARVRVGDTTPLIRRLCGAAFICGVAATSVFLLISLSPGLEGFVRLQPMRSFQLLYIFMFLIVGGWLGEFVLRAHAWRWALLLLALGGMDVAITRSAYPASPQIEWPDARSSNAWIEAFEWARGHTDEHALFALSPEYVEAPGEDRHGFRAIAERSSLADEVKDSSVVSMLPALAPEWKKEMNAQSGFDSFAPADFHRLAETFSVQWVVVELRQTRGLDCPYKNKVVAVCRIG